MTPELQKYYEDRFNLFSMDGWKDLIEDIDKIIASINNIATVSALVSSVSYSETAIVHINNTSVAVTIIADGSNVVISNSGLNIQVRQNSGGTVSELIWSAARIL